MAAVYLRRGRKASSSSRNYRSLKWAPGRRSVPPVKGKAPFQRSGERGRCGCRRLRNNCESRLREAAGRNFRFAQNIGEPARQLPEETSVPAEEKLVLPKQGGINTVGIPASRRGPQVVYQNSYLTKTAVVGLPMATKSRALAAVSRGG